MVWFLLINLKLNSIALRKEIAGRREIKGRMTILLNAMMTFFRECVGRAGWRLALIIFLGAGVWEVGAGTISGTVTDASGTSPLSNISVEVYLATGSGWNFSSSQQTDINGQYQIQTTLGAGNYVVRFSDPAGNYLEQFYNQASSFFTASNIFVSILGEVSGINAFMDAVSSISGTVSAPEGGTPLENIYVTAFRLNGFDWEEAGDALSDSNGDYAIGGLSPGNYRVKFTDWAGNYLSEWYDNQPSLDAADDVAVPLSSAVNNINAELGLASKITGTVIDSSSLDPIENVSVTAYRWNGDYFEYTSISSTDSEGSYVISGLESGTYRVEFYDGNGVYVTIYYNDALDLSSANDIVVGSEATVTDIDAAMFSASSISGTVIDLDDAPLSTVEVTAYLWDGADWTFAGVDYTSGSGTYEIGSLAPGTYRVSFHGWAYGYPIWYYQQVLTLDDASDIIVDSGVVVTGINAQIYQPDVNEAPVDIELSGSTASENQPSGTIVGDFTTVDADDGDTFVYSLVEGDGSADNSLFAIDNDTLITAESLNYESQTSRTIRVRSTDQGDLFTEKIFTIFILDVDEVPVLMSADRIPSDSIVLRWSSLTNQEFAIRHSTNLMNGFILHTGGIGATPPMNSHTVLLNSAGTTIFQVTTDD